MTELVRPRRPGAAPLSPARPVARARPPNPRTEIRWLWLVLGGQLLFQALLLTPAGTAARMPLRVAAFGFSLLALVALHRPGPRHPALPWALGGIALSAVLGLTNPDSDSWLASASALILALAIFGPLRWAARLPATAVDLERVLLVLWGYHVASSLLGVLQVVFPGRFQPELSTALLAQGESYVRSLEFVLPNGQLVLRPMGLTDVPGGAATSGYYAVLFGIGLLWSRRGAWRPLAVAGMAAGMAAVYLSHVRVTLASLVICMVALAVVISRRAEWSRLIRLAIVVLTVVVGGLIWAVTVGGASVSDRVNTLVEDDPSEVYYSNRGHFLEDTFDSLLLEYPLGAGLGRWGQLPRYFGEHPERELWVEIQWTGWLYDGGIPMMAAMILALGWTLWWSWRVAVLARARQGNVLAAWAPLIFAYDVGALATTFSYPLFVSQGGMEFWLLNGLLFACAHRLLAQPSPPPAPIRSPTR